LTAGLRDNNLQGDATKIIPRGVSKNLTILASIVLVPTLMMQIGEFVADGQCRLVFFWCGKREDNVKCATPLVVA
jgi:hypothetical protein